QRRPADSANRHPENQDGQQQGCQNNWAHKVSSFQEYHPLRPAEILQLSDQGMNSSIQFKSAASQSKKLKPNLSTIVSSHSGLSLELEDKKEHECHFTSTLQTASLDNLSIPFRRLHRTIEPITRSLPLLIHHQEQVSTLGTRLSSGKTKRNESSDLEKERKRRLIQAREAVNLVATSVLDLFPTALSKASEVIVHLFKTLAKDLTPSSLPPSEVNDQSEENSQRLKSIWSLVRNALGHPCQTIRSSQKLTIGVRMAKIPTRKPAEPIHEETENADIDLPEYNEADPNDETKQLETCPVDTNPISSGLGRFELGRSGKVAKHGTLHTRKQKVQAARKGTSVRSLLGEEQGGARVFAEGICWALGETCKSIDHRLHSRASAILISTDSQRFGLSANLDNTSHNCRHFEPILDALTTRATARLATTKPDCGARVTENVPVALETSLQCLATVAGVRNGSRLSQSCLFRILSATLDLLGDDKFKDCDHLSSTTAMLSLNLLSSIKDHSEFLSTPEVRKALDKLFQVQNPPLSIEHVYRLASSLHRLNWTLFDDFLLPKLLAIIPNQLCDPNSRKIKDATHVVLDLLSHFHSSSIDAPIEELDSQKMSLKECYDWISISSLLPIDNFAVHHDKIDEWCQRVLTIQHHLVPMCPSVCEQNISPTMNLVPPSTGPCCYPQCSTSRAVCVPLDILAHVPCY
ncbi:hypothetical protein KEM48_009475, partial [Puccinia striiformis f. sp. tritici PST-130]